MSEEEIMKEIEIIKETQDIMQHNLDIYPPKEDIYRLDTKQLKAVICLLDRYQKEKEKNKKLDRENQALYESINCNDNTMLARLYQEEKEKKDKIINKMGQELFIEIEPHFDTLEQCIEFYTNKVEEENK